MSLALNTIPPAKAPTSRSSDALNPALNTIPPTGEVVEVVFARQLLVRLSTRLNSATNTIPPTGNVVAVVFA